MWLSSSQQTQAMYGISEGQLYIFDQGVTKECSMTFVLNEAQQILKKAIAVQILSPIQSPFTVELTADTGLTTDIQQDEFEEREGNLFASVKAASNSVGGKWDGKDMHGYIYMMKISDNSNSQKQLTFAKVTYSESATNQR
jgi:hypothetical protein